MAYLTSLLGNPIALILILLLVGLYFLWKHRSDKGGNATSVLSEFTRDLSAEAADGKNDPVAGRDEEISRVIHILSRKTKNNPILIGEPGVGKTAIVEGLVNRIAAGDVPENLKSKSVLALDLGGMISGTKFRGEFEERVKGLLNELTAADRKFILFIDEVHMIVQAKGAEGSLNVSDILKPALARGDLQTIGATTQNEYDQYIRPDDALDRRFQPVPVGEPDNEGALAILHKIRSVYEDYHHVQYAEDALRAAVVLSHKYIKNRYLPDKAIDLMDEAGAKVAIESVHEEKHGEGVRAAIANDKRKHLEEVRRRRTLLKEEQVHLESLMKKLPGEQELEDTHERLAHVIKALEDVKAIESEGAPLVSKEDIREIVAEWSEIPLDQVTE